MRFLHLPAGLIIVVMGVRMRIGGGRGVKGGLNFGVGGGWRFGFSFLCGGRGGGGC